MRQQLKDKKQEIGDTVRNLCMKHDVLSHKQYEEHMSLLETKFAALD